jgi:hypothetical protein
MGVQFPLEAPFKDLIMQQVEVSAGSRIEGLIELTVTSADGTPEVKKINLSQPINPVVLGAGDTFTVIQTAHGYRKNGHGYASEQELLRITAK